MVDESLPKQSLLVPEDSVITINCKLLTYSSTPLWSIDLGSDQSVSQLQFGSRTYQLNANGVYELPSVETKGMPLTIRLLINDTSMTNKTKVICNGGDEESITTLYVYGKI